MNRFSHYCSRDCFAAGSKTIVQRNRERTCLERYGSRTPSPRQKNNKPSGQFFNNVTASTIRNDVPESVIRRRKRARKSTEFHLRSPYTVNQRQKLNNESYPCYAMPLVTSKHRSALMIAGAWTRTSQARTSMWRLTALTGTISTSQLISSWNRRISRIYRDAFATSKLINGSLNVVHQSFE